MAIVRPFRAIRPAKEKAEEVISLPYDVMNREEAALMAEGKPDNFLHICRSEIDLPEVEDVYSKVVYEKAKSNIEERLAKGVFIEEDEAAYYVYRQKMDGRYQSGIVACVSIDEYENNQIKKHELTRVEKELDRINHFDTCSCNTESVFLTFRDTEGIKEIMESVMEGEAEYAFTDENNIGHELWVVKDAKTKAAIESSFEKIPALYIADGHHRSASAYKVGKKRREEVGSYTGEEEFNFFMSVIFPQQDLKIFDYNRVVKDLNGLTKEEFFEEIEKHGFVLEEMGTEIYRPVKLHEFSMYIDGKWYKLTANDEIVPDDVIGALDVSVLQNNLLNPILGIQDPRTDKRIDFVGGIRGLGELERRSKTDMILGIAVYPVSMDELMNIADCGEVMPPKSTWFEPKLGSGLFMHKF